MSAYPLSAPSERARNIVLIGYRATGKTTVARLLAQRLGWPWLDADDLIEAQAGTSIRQLFAAEGEAGFRARESAALEQCYRRDEHVIAAGGGIVLVEANRTRLQTAGLVVWLRADPATVWQRMIADASSAERRPNLSIGGLAEVEELLRRREPLYRSCAACQVETAGRTTDEVAEAVLGHWRHSQATVQRKEP